MARVTDIYVNDDHTQVALVLDGGDAGIELFDVNYDGTTSVTEVPGGWTDYVTATHLSNSQGSGL